MLPKVRTSDGFMIDWNKDKIIDQLIKESSLAKQFFDVAPMTKKEAGMVAHIVENRVIAMNPPFVSSPMVRELVNNTLLELSASEPDFLIYRNVMTRVGTPVYDAYKIDVGDGFERNENANLQNNPETIHKKKADLMSKEQYLLLMPPELANAHHGGDIHIHTLEYFGSRPFCMDHDLRYFLYYGFIADGLGYKSSVAGPPQHASVAVLQSVKALAASQTNFSGGQGFMNYTVFLAPYLRGLPYDAVKQLAQMVFFECTQTYIARGGQPVFSSLQIPMGVPDIWKNVPVVMKGRIGPDTYSSYEDEVRTFYKAIQDVSINGDFWGKPFNFPKQENYVSPEFFKSEYDDLWLLAHANVAKNGSQYFDNMIPEYRGYGNGVACYQCCAYNFSSNPENDEHFAEKLNFEDGAHFSMGGWQVASINMPRLAYRANGDYDKLLEYAQENMRKCIDVFKVKKMWMDAAIKNGTLPFATQRPRDINGKQGPPLVDFSELVYVIGVVGINEMVQHFTTKQLHESADAVKLAVRLLIDMEKYRKGLQMKTGMKLSLARTPAESTAQTFAVQDLMSEFKPMARNTIKGDLTYLDKVNGRDIPLYYTNGTHINVSANIPLAQKIDIEQKFFPILSGGNIFQVWMGENNSDPEGLYKLTKKIVNNSQIGYFAYTRDLTICSDCNSTSGGLLDSCPTCGSKNVKNWSRITGYYSDVSGWNSAKKKELMDRVKMKL